MSAPTKEQALAALNAMDEADAWSDAREILRSFIEGAAEQTPVAWTTPHQVANAREGLVAISVRTEEFCVPLYASPIRQDTNGGESR
jgi:hypothetical protein